MSFTAETTAEYQRRIDRVLDYMRQHTDRTLTLAELAHVAGFSAFHFHRIFRTLQGETVKLATARLRAEKAARLLRYSKRSLLDIALSCGHSSPATFSRAFRDHFGNTPSAFRKTGEIGTSKIRKAVFDASSYLLPMSLIEKKAAFPIHITELPASTISYIRVRNAFEGERVRSAFCRLISHIQQTQSLSKGWLFGQSIDDPHVTPKNQYSYEACFASTTALPTVPGITITQSPARRYAMARVAGDLRLVATAWDYLFRHWLTSSEFEPAHAPALEIFLEPSQATDWSHFNLDLCLPIQTMNLST